MHGAKSLPLRHNLNWLTRCSACIGFYYVTFVFILNKMSHILGRWSRLKRITQGNSLTVVSSPKPAYYSSGFHAFLTPETNPANHTVKDIGLFYKINNELSLNSLFKDAKLDQNYVEECKTFQGTHIMIRRPALEIINCLKHTNYENPVNRYVLFGKRGYGVSMTMCHIVHYAHVSDWLVVHVPGIIQWLTAKTERVQSDTKEGLLDLPALGSAWLSHFKNQNLNVIKKLDLRLQNDYTWNIQEENKKGESLLGLLDHGITRAKYSCDVIVALMDEVKANSKLGLVKSLVAIDNYSVIFHPGRRSSNPKYKNLAPSQLSFIDSIKNMAKADWHNGAVVLSCLSEKTITHELDHLPLNKLTLKGFEFLDPFIPVEVPQLTYTEMANVLEFYKSEKWLLTSEADKELMTLSGGNMKILRDICGAVG